MNVKGMMMGMMGVRKPVSFVLALIFLALGVLPLLYNFGVVGFELPAIPQIILYVLAVIGGIWLFYDGTAEMGGIGFFSLQKITYLMGVVVLAFGLIPLLNMIGVIGFTWPDFAKIIIDILYIIAGGLLFVGGVQGI